jgi:hypothetical protein
MKRPDAAIFCARSVLIFSGTSDGYGTRRRSLSPAPTPPAPALGFDSLIVPQYLPLFEEFRAKRFNLLWRGSRDDFNPESHRSSVDAAHRYRYRYRYCHRHRAVILRLSHNRQLSLH